MLLAAGWLCAVACVAILILSAARVLTTADPTLHAVCLFGFALILAPLAFYLISQIAAPIFLPRYLIPSALGIALLAVTTVRQSRPGKGATLTALSFAVLLLPIATPLLARPAALNVARVDQIADHRPIVCDSLKDFLVMTRYSAWPDRPEYPLDETAALTAPGNDTDVRLMKNYRRQGFFAANLPDPAQILNRKSFLVLDTAGAPWFHVAIENNPRYTWRVLAQIDPSRRILEIDQNR
jgi:hypothetical protein